jgi:hypothetical protein
MRTIGNKQIKSCKSPVRNIDYFLQRHSTAANTMYRGETDGLPQSLQPRGSNSDDKQSFGSASTVTVDALSNNYVVKLYADGPTLELRTKTPYVHSCIR